MTTFAHISDSVYSKHAFEQILEGLDTSGYTFYRFPPEMSAAHRQTVAAFLKLDCVVTSKKQDDDSQIIRVFVKELGSGK